MTTLAFFQFILEHTPAIYGACMGFGLTQTLVKHYKLES